MKRLRLISILFITVGIATAFKSSNSKLVSQKTHVKFFSTTTAEDIEAHNYKSVSSINTKNGEVVFSVPMQSFEFDKALMQKHFNSEKFLDTKANPKAKLVGKIINFTDINFDKNGNYNVTVEGELTLHGVTKPISEKATITVTGNVINVNSKFNITLSEYGVAFEKGKPSTNIAKTVEVLVEGEYQSEK